MSILVTMIAAVLVFLFSLLLMEGDPAMIPNYVDVPGLLMLVCLVVPILISAGLFKDFIAAFRRAYSKKARYTRADLQRSMEAVRLAERSCWSASEFVFMIAFCFLCRFELGFYDDEWTASRLGWNMSVAALPFLYAALMNLMLMAVQGRLKKRFIDYMGADELPEQAHGEAETRADGTANGD